MDSNCLTLEPGVLNNLQRFFDSPDAGDPNCLCSLCKKIITDDEIPIRFWPMPKGPMWEIRLHHSCFEKIIKNGGGRSSL